MMSKPDRAFSSAVSSLESTASIQPSGRTLASQWRTSSRNSLRSCVSSMTQRMELDPELLRDELPVVRRVAEVDLRRLRTAEVQVRVVLPREADAAVDLDVLGGAVEVRVRAVRLGERRGQRQLLGVLGRRPAGVVRGRTRHLDLHEHVRALVLDRLERTDRTSELVALLRVLRRRV